MGETRRSQPAPESEYIAFSERTGGSETSQYPQEKEIKRDSLSSGERTGKSLNPLYVKDSSLCTEGVMGLSGTAGTVPRSYKIRF